MKFARISDDRRIGLEEPEGRAPYVETLSIISALHHRLNGVIKYWLDRAGHAEITSAQAHLIYGLGEKTLSVRELLGSCHALGNNASHNLKKLADLKYLVRHHSEVDRRLIMLRLTPKGLAVYRLIDDLYDQQIRLSPVVADISNSDFEFSRAMLRKFERLWHERIYLRT
jgi:DNA-binding MarR family transcriptional regulator